MTELTSVGSMSAMWREINLPALQTDLDKVASEIAKRQDDSVASRKILVSESKKFNKNLQLPDEVKSQVDAMIKLFKSEIDKLSKRSKFAETSFLNAYKKILEVPDPVPALEVGEQLQRGVQRQHDAEQENKKLRETIDQNNKDLSEAKRTEREMTTLKKKISELENNLEKEGNKRVEKKEKELNTKFAEQESQLQETQLLVAGKLEEEQQKSAELAQKYAAAQQELFKVRSETEEKMSSKQAELDMLNNDLERLNAKVANDDQEITELNAEVERLRVSNIKKAEALSMNEGDDKNSSDQNNMEQLKVLNAGLERDLREKERELGQQISDMQHLQENLKISREHHQADKSRLENVLTEKDTNIKELEFKLSRCRDYEEIRRELQVLKSVEFPESKPKISVSSLTNDQDGDHSKSTSSELELETKTHKSLEVLLLEKNRTLQSENTQLRLQQTDLAERYEQSQKNQTEQRIELEKQEKLIRQLESDLLSINHTHRDVMKSIKRPAAEGAPSMIGSETTNFTHVTNSTQKYNSPFIPQQSGSMSTELISDAVKGKTSELLGASADTAMALHQVKQQNSAIDGSILQIVSSQRERFRQRVQELEEHSHLQSQTIQMMQSDMEQLRTDNVKLYEKIKFLQSYNGQISTDTRLNMSRAVGGAFGSNNFNTGTNYEDLASRKYAGQYEEQLDPFAKFSQRERARKYMNLAPHDKVTLSMGRVILGSKTARTITFFYTIFIHCLLYLILYRFANQDDCSKAGSLALGKKCNDAGYFNRNNDPFANLVQNGADGDHPGL